MAWDCWKRNRLFDWEVISPSSNANTKLQSSSSNRCVLLFVVVLPHLYFFGTCSFDTSGMKGSLGHSNLLGLVFSQDLWLCLAWGAVLRSLALSCGSRHTLRVPVNLSAVISCFIAISVRCKISCSKGYLWFSAAIPSIDFVFILSFGASSLFQCIEETGGRNWVARNFLELWALFNAMEKNP